MYTIITANISFIPQTLIILIKGSDLLASDYLLYNYTGSVTSAIFSTHPSDDYFKYLQANPDSFAKYVDASDYLSEL